MVHIDGLPNVQANWARSNICHVACARALVTVQAIAGAIDALARIGGNHSRRFIAFARGQDDFAGQQQLAGTHRGAANHLTLDTVNVIAAPRKRKAPNLTVLKTCTFGGGKLNDCVIVAAATLVAFAHVLADADFGALGLALAHPPAVKIENVCCIVRQRHERHQAVEIERVGADVGYFRRDFDQARCRELIANGDLKAGVVVARNEFETVLRWGCCANQFKLLAKGFAGTMPLKRWLAQECPRIFAPSSPAVRLIKQPVRCGLSNRA